MSTPARSDKPSSGSLQYIVGADGKTTAVILDIDTWRQVIDAINAVRPNLLGQVLGDPHLQEDSLSAANSIKVSMTKEEKAKFIEQTYGAMSDAPIQRWPEGPFEARESME
ncbi:MAG TPA: hypothetical protein VFS21_11115 [Roseiflexaceae bacterium]|nr:hypothetical protein [Roseiflexaceae bacterium]